MKVCAARFNLYLTLTVALALICGCQSHKKKEKPAALRVHIEMNSDLADSTKTISVLRSTPVLVTIGHDPILTEANVVAARVVELPGGFAVEIKFDETGAWILEQYSAGNPGKHFAIFGIWANETAKSANDETADGRWLAAPLISHRIGDGVLTFTPDASREEADEFVRGLNQFAKDKNSKKF